MRRKKHKHTRRALRFYRINFGFRPPYKVLLDGNFVHALEALKKGESKDLLARLVGDAVKCYTTPCVQKELKKLGKDFSATRRVLKQYALHKCGHEEHCSAADCLLAQLGEKNEEHFFVATQDRSLQRKCMSVPGGAVLYASVNGVHLDTPSAMQKQQVKQEDQRHMLPSQGELQRAGLLAEGGEAPQQQQEEEQQQQQQPRDRPAMRRNRAKAPNPLAMRPKQKKKSAVAAGGGGEGAAAAAAGGAAAAAQQQQQAAGASGGGGGSVAAGSAGGEQQQEGKRKRQRRRGKGAGEHAGAD